MFVTKTSFCFFVVWTPVNFHVQMISYDALFCTSLVAKLKAAHTLVILPELLGEYFTKTRHITSLDSSNTVICFCRKVKQSGRLVFCANGKENCPIYKFHEDCVLQKQSRVTSRWKCDHCKDGNRRRKLQTTKCADTSAQSISQRSISIKPCATPLPLKQSNLQSQQVSSIRPK